jgi:hypothetical protein
MDGVSTFDKHFLGLQFIFIIFQGVREVPEINMWRVVPVRERFLLDKRWGIDETSQKDRHHRRVHLEEELLDQNRKNFLRDKVEEVVGQFGVKVRHGREPDPKNAKKVLDRQDKQE